MAKMSEASIARAYSNYLQAVAIASEAIVDQQQILGYDEFKEYYILKLVGKANYVDNLVRKIQQDMVSSSN